MATHGRFLGIGALVACAAALWIPAPAAAALIQVTDTADDLVSAADDGDCALREAIEAANRNAAVDGCTAGEAEPAADTLELANGATYTLTGASSDDANESGDLDVSTAPDSGPLTISGGNESVIDAGGIDRAIDLRGSLSLEGVTITNGISPGWGGGIHNVGGALSLSHSRISGNAALLGAGIGNEGGTLNVTASVVVDNQAGTNQEEHVAGGGILNQGVAIIDGSVIASNHAQGLRQLLAAGAGIANLSGASLTVTDSTVAGNAMSGGMQFGAGVYHEGGGSNLGIRNSTISGNVAPAIGADGGGLALFGGDVSLNHVTIAGNFAEDQGSAMKNFGGEAVSLRASVIDDGANGCQGPISSAGFNVDAGATCASAANSTDLQNVATGLDLHLVNNGGPQAGPPGSSEIPQTHALFDTSPAVDRVPAGQCFDVGAALLTADQRGEPRPLGPAGCDSGAYELDVPIPVTSGGTTTPGFVPQQQQQLRKKCKKKRKKKRKRATSKRKRKRAAAKWRRCKRRR